jgi:hypothetical protein
VSLCPLQSAARHLREAARYFEQARLRDEAHEADLLAQRALRIDAEQDAEITAALACADDEIDAYEQTTGRRFDQWVQSATDAEIEASLTTLAPLMRSVGGEGRRFQSNGDA